MKRVPFLFVLLLGLIQPPAWAQTPRADNTLRLAFESDPNSLDPLQLWSNDAATVCFLVFQALLDQRPDGRLEPVVARELPAISADHRVYTFHLRPGIRFSNGRELTADDVVYSVERGCDPSTAMSPAAFFRNIEGHAEFAAARRKELDDGKPSRGTPALRTLEPKTVSGLRAVDRHTFELRLKTPDLTALPFLASIGIVPAEEVCRSGIPFGSRPVGSGPFVLERWNRGLDMRFVPNPMLPPERRPRFAAVEVLLNVPTPTQAMMFERGEIDFVTFFSDVDSYRWRRDPVRQKQLVNYKGAALFYLALNCEMPPFTNRVVRQALNHAVNKEALVRKLLNRAVPAHGPLPTIVRGYNPALPGYPFDPGKASRLLADAGFPDGFKTTLWAMPGDPMAFSVQEDLRAVGVEAELHLVSWPTLMESMQRRGAVPMGLMNAPATDEPKDYLDLLLSGDNITDAFSSNMAFYSNPEVQQRLRTAAVATDESDRIRQYQRIEERIIEDAPWVFLCHADFEVIRQPWVKGSHVLPVWPPMRVESAWTER